MDALQHGVATSRAGPARGGFAGQLGMTLAIGLGLTGPPAGTSPVHALGSNHCCPSNCTLPSGGSCGAGTQKFYCTGQCPFCCICLSGSSCIDSVGGCIC